MSKLFVCCVPLQKDFSTFSNMEKYAHVESFKILVLPIFKIRKCIADSETCKPNNNKKYFEIYFYYIDL